MALLRNLRFLKAAIASMQFSPYQVRSLKQASKRHLLKIDDEKGAEYEGRELAEPVTDVNDGCEQWPPSPCPLAPLHLTGVGHEQLSPLPTHITNCVQ